MPLALGLSLVLAIVWTDSCKRHLWESLGPLHHFGCDCRGYRYYCRHDPAGDIFSFSIEPPEDLANSGRGTLDMTIVEVAGPKSSFSFVAVQLGVAVRCSRGLAAASPMGSLGVHQELRLPVPSRMPRHLHLFLYGRNRPGGERLLAIAKVPLDATRLFGLQDITVPFLNYDGVPAGHVRMLMRMGAPGSATLSTIDMIPYMAEASDMSDDCCGGGGRQSDRPVTGEERPIVVFSAGGKPAIAVPLEPKPEAERDNETKEGAKKSAPLDATAPRTQEPAGELRVEEEAVPSEAMPAGSEEASAEGTVEGGREADLTDGANGRRALESESSSASGSSLLSSGSAVGQLPTGQSASVVMVTAGNSHPVEQRSFQPIRIPTVI